MLSQARGLCSPCPSPSSHEPTAGFSTSPAGTPLLELTLDVLRQHRESSTLRGVGGEGRLTVLDSFSYSEQTSSWCRRSCLQFDLHPLQQPAISGSLLAQTHPNGGADMPEIPSEVSSMCEQVVSLLDPVQTPQETVRLPVPSCNHQRVKVQAKAVMSRDTVIIRARSASMAIGQAPQALFSCRKAFCAKKDLHCTLFE